MEVNQLINGLNRELLQQAKKDDNEDESSVQGTDESSNSGD